MSGRQSRAIRKAARETLSGLHREVWVTLCSAPWQRRLVLAARLLCGRPYGVWKEAKAR